uniref:Uncharacterized protein MANES_11G033500 n=1 Tax=Rhizophora mucronata TaxID=61149 RepID=A0A2P2K0L7_RHIMU
MHALFLNYKLHLLMKTKELQHVLLLFLLHTVMCSSYCYVQQPRYFKESTKKHKVLELNSIGFQRHST